MQKKSDDFSMQEAMRLAESPQAQQLMALLQRTDGSALQQAMDAANTGDYQKAAQTIRKLLTPEMEALIKDLGG